MNDLLELCNIARKWGYKPYFPAIVDGKEVEIISFPFPLPCKKIGIKIRDFNDPDSIRDAIVPIDYILDIEVLNNEVD